MFDNSFLGRTLYLCKKGMDASVLRKQTIANNIANVNTPHYKRQEVLFESELNRVLSNEKKPRFKARTTDSRHIQFDIDKDYREVGMKVHTEWDTNYKNDKSNVDIEKEMADEVKNTLRYRALTTIISSQFTKLKTVMR